MKKYLLLIFIAFSFTGHAFAAYTDQETLVIDHTKVSSTQTNFTVLATSTQSVMKTVGNGGKVQNANGYDIVYSSTPCLAPTLLNWENEKYVASTGEEDDWILFTSLSSIVDTTFYRCFGNSAISTFQGGATGTAWDSNYKAVYHFPNGTSLTTNDSTSNGVNMTTSGTPTAVAGQVDGAINLVNASSQYASNSSNLLSSAMTTEAWFKPASFPNAYGTIVGVDGTTPFYDFHVKSNGKLAMYTRMLGSGTTVFYDGTGATLSAGTWYHIVMTYDSVNGLKGYINAAVDGTAAASGTIDTPGTIVEISNDLPNFGGRYVDGIIDEVRVSNTARSANWITTEYNNQSSVATFMTIGNDTPLGASFSPWQIWEF